MEYSISFLASFVVLLLLGVSNGQPLVPAVFIFGDSIADVGNNNNRLVPLKANFPPYGRDSKNHIPTGRFSNGNTTIDRICENLGFTSSPPAYLNLKFKGNNLLHGANFATAGSGYHDYTSKLYNGVLLSQQLEYFKECQKELVRTVGESDAYSIISGAVYIVSGGRSDFLPNYYLNPLLHNVYPVDMFSDILLQYYSNFIKGLYALGARRVGVITLGPLGCIPMAITLLSYSNNKCVKRLNNDAMNFNNKLNSTSESLIKMLPGLNLVLLDLNPSFYDLVINPTKYGFSEARRACCGTGLIEISLLCNQNSIGTCTNASRYVFWDSFHLTDEASKVTGSALIPAELSLIS